MIARPLAEVFTVSPSFTWAVFSVTSLKSVWRAVLMLTLLLITVNSEGWGILFSWIWLLFCGCPASFGVINNKNAPINMAIIMNATMIITIGFTVNLLDL